METYISRQAIAFLWAVAVGGILGAVYDGFRIGRILWRKGRFWVFLEDFLFGIIAAFCTFWSLAGTNDGQVRLFLLLGELAGFILYRNSFGLLTMAFARLLIRLLAWLKRKFRGFFAIFLKILRKIMNFLKKLFIFLFGWCRIILLYFKKRRACRWQEQEN